MTSTTDLSTREFVRGLMRGSKSDLRRGYTAENAILAVTDARQLEGAEASGLAAYAWGYNDGLNAARLPEVKGLPDHYDEGWSADDKIAYQRGLEFGRGEDQSGLNPSIT